MEVAKAASQITELDAKIFYVKHLLEVEDDPKEAMGVLNDLIGSEQKEEMGERMLTWAELLFK